MVSKDISDATLVTVGMETVMSDAETQATITNGTGKSSMDELIAHEFLGHGLTQLMGGTMREIWNN